MIDNFIVSRPFFRDGRHLGEEAAGQLQDADLSGANRQGEDLDQAQRCLIIIKLGKCSFSDSVRRFDARI